VIAPNHSHHSSALLEIAKDLGICTGGNDDSPPSADAYQTFSKAYRQWAQTRDVALDRHLREKAGLFRCVVPYTDRVFQLAHRVVWYLDEIVISDPILRHIGSAPDDNAPAESHRRWLASLVSQLRVFRQALDSGYVLFGGPSVVPRMGSGHPPHITSVANQADLVEALDRSVRFGLRKGTLPDGRSFAVAQAKLDSGGHVLFQLERPLEGDHIPIIQVGELLPEVDPTELTHLFGLQVMENARKMYPREVYFAVHYTEIASRLDAAVLFDRQAHALAIEHALNTEATRSRQARICESLNLALPYVDMVPPDRLLDLRNEIPGSFLEFRARVADIVAHALRDDPENASAAARIAADKELIPAIKNLEADLRSVAYKTRILGYGLPGVAAVASLVGTVLGADASHTLTVLAGGAAMAVKAYADSAMSRERAPCNPFYFLWRAKTAGSYR